jgi:AraC-like DNA-binding protein
VRFRPGGAHAFLRGPVETWTDRIVPIDAVEERALVELHARLHEAPRAGRLELLEEALFARALRGGRTQHPLCEPVEALLAGRLGVDGAAHLAGVGARQLQRRFRREVGVGPRTLARLGRLQRASRLLAAGVPATDAAHAAGFSDQSHLGRDFRALAGTTPAAYQREASPLGSAFAGPGA